MERTQCQFKPQSPNFVSVPSGEWPADPKALPAGLPSMSEYEIRSRIAAREAACAVCDGQSEEFNPALCKPECRCFPECQCGQEKCRCKSECQCGQAECRKNQWDCVVHLRGLEKFPEESKTLFVHWLDAKSVTHVLYPCVGIGAKETHDETSDAKNASDATQNAKMRLMQKVETIIAIQNRNKDRTRDGDVGVRRYVRATYKNALLDLYRQEKKQEEIKQAIGKKDGGAPKFGTHGDVNSQDGLGPGYSPTFEKDLENREFVQSLMSVLTPKDRYILKLRYWDGLTLQEIGAIVGLDHANVGRRIMRSQTKMRVIVLYVYGKFLYVYGKLSIIQISEKLGIPIKDVQEDLVGYYHFSKKWSDIQISKELDMPLGKVSELVEQAERKMQTDV